MKRILIFVLVPVLLFGCKKDDDPGSGEAEILNFSVTPSDAFVLQQVSIEKENNQIHIFSNSYIDDGTYPLSFEAEIEVSPGATITPASGSVVNFAGREEYIQYSTQSENGSFTADWIAILRDNQIPNSSFDNWHETQGLNGLYFNDIGKYSESTVWATANKGTSTYSIYGTTKLDVAGNSMVKIQTAAAKTPKETGSIDSIAVIPVAAATLFLGKFDIQGAIQNPTDPEKATDFGMPFVYSPTAIKFKFKYKSGAQLIQGTLKNPASLFGGFDIVNLSGKDNYKIYSSLEARDGEIVKEIASFEIRGEDTPDILTEIVVPYEYTSDEIPTHISLVFTSSADGSIWKGAVGSTLIIDDLELIYE